MTLPLVPDRHPPQHLTGDQLSDLLTAACDDLGAAEAHLRSCELCAAELAGLRESLAFFREASVALADREFAQLQRPVHRVLPGHRPFLQTAWCVAAAAILMAGIVPIEMRWQNSLHAAASVTASVSAPTAQSDEALLEDIDREISVSVPASMQALADPTNTAASAPQTSTQTSTQRKD